MRVTEYLCLTIILFAFVYSITAADTETMITKYESETVQLTCYTTSEDGIDWEISNNPIVGNHPYRRIYASGYLMRVFEETGRYSMSIGDGFYNLTISNLTVNDTGDYSCTENAGIGPRRTTRLEVHPLYKKPEVVTTIKGRPVTLCCKFSSDFIVHWHYRKNETAEPTTIDDQLTAGNITVVDDRKKGNYSIVLKSAHPEQSGLYECVEYHCGGRKHVVILTVTELSSPMIDTATCMKKQMVPLVATEGFLSETGDSSDTSRLGFIVPVAVAVIVVAVLVLITVFHRLPGFYAVSLTRRFLQQPRKDAETEHFITQSARQNAIRLNAGKFVTGLIYIDDKILVINFNSDTIKRFEGRPPYTALSDIIIEGQKDLRSIAACDDTRQIFVADRTAKCIWRVDVTSNYSVDKFMTTEYKPWGLSVKSGRLLITNDNANYLYVHSVVDGHQLLRVPLPFTAYHAIEYTPDTLLVCHQVDDETDGRLHSVSQIDKQGNIIRKYTGPTHVNRPRNMSVDSEGRILVADYYGDRVVVLDSELNFQNELNYEGHVNRVFYVKSTSQLLVGVEDHSVQVLDWQNSVDIMNSV